MRSSSPIDRPAAFKALTLAFPTVDALDQLGIMSDSWSLGLGGLEPPFDVLALVDATPATADPQVWGKIAGILGELDQYYRGQDARRAVFRSFGRARLKPVLAGVGWTARPGEAEPVATLRNTLIVTLGELGDAEVIAEARRRQAGRTVDGTLPAAIRKAVLYVVAQHADAAAWENLHRAALAETTPLVKDELYDLLASADDAVLARRALDLALTDEPGATSSAGMIRRVGDHHPDLAYDFAVAHLTQVDERVDAPSRSRYFPALAAGSADPAMIGKINAYALAHLAPGARRDADTAAAEVAYNIKVRAERLPVLDAWLEKNGADRVPKRLSSR